MILQQIEDSLYLDAEVSHLTRLSRCSTVGLCPFMDSILHILREADKKSADELKMLLPEIPDNNLAAQLYLTEREY